MPAKDRPTSPTTPPADEAAQPLVIGWKERIDFPDWHVNNIIAKSDTGARTGAIDITEVEEVADGMVRFIVRLHRTSGDVSRRVTAKISRRSRVRSAFGHAHDRLFIETVVRIGTVEKTIELGLVSRKKMICRVLLGRKALEGDFLVDSKRRYLLSKPRKRKKLPGSANPTSKKDSS